MIVIGFSQTLTFREYARELILTEINSSISGNLNIERIDGTILTSIFLRNVTLTTGPDTVFSTKKIELKTSPLQLLLKKIYIRKFEIENASIFFKQLSDSSWNIDRAFASINPTKKSDEQNSTENSGSSFDYEIVLNNLSLRNMSFKNKSIEYLDKSIQHDVLETNDLELNNLFLDANININLLKQHFFIDLLHLSAGTNFGNFNLLDFNAQLEIDKEYASINHLTLKSDSTNLEIIARLDNFNLLGLINLQDFENYPMSVELNADPFYFNDLTAFIGATDILVGSPQLKLKADGKFGDFSIENMVVDLGKTHCELTGRIQHLHTPANFIIDAYMKNSEFHYVDAYNLLRPLELPKFNNLFIGNTTAYFKGEPTTFYATIFSTTGEGQLSGDCFLNTQTDDLEYDVSLETINYNFSNVIGTDTKLNSVISVEGSGTSPDTWDADIICDITDSKVSNYRIDSLSLSADAITLAANLNFGALVNDASIQLTGNIDYNNRNIPKYDLTGVIENFNLAKFSEDSTIQSNFNFDIALNGEHTDIDTISGKFLLTTRNSTLNSRVIPDAKMELGLSRNRNQRRISLISDFADMNIYGNFALSEAIDLVSYQASAISKIVTNKMIEFDPLNTSGNKTNKSFTYPSVLDKNLELNYMFNFKDLSLVALFMNIDELDISGYGEGSVKNDSTNFSVSADLFFNYLLYKEESSFYLTEFETDINFARQNRISKFDNIFGTLFISGDELFSGTKFQNLYTDITFNEDEIFFNSSLDIETELRSEVEGNIQLTGAQKSINIDRINTTYKGLEWKNYEPVHLLFSSENMEIPSFYMNYDSLAYLGLQGKVFKNGDLDILFSAKNIPGIIFSRYIFDSQNNSLATDFNLSASLRGNVNSPLLSAFISASEVKYDDTPLGRLSTQINYSSGILTNSLYLLDSKGNTKLNASGTLPIYLGLGEEPESIGKEEVDIRVKTLDLNLSQFGNAIPNISQQEGLLNADIKIFGSYDNLQYAGYINVPDLTFRSTDNNLAYNLKLSAKLINEKIEVEDISISNTEGSTYSGAISGDGEISFNGFTLDKINMRSNGELAVLAKSSKIVSPFIHGDLFIGTDGDLMFTYENGNASLDGALLLREMDLTYVLANSTGPENNSFIYKILVDSSKLDMTKLRIAKFLSSIDQENQTTLANKKTPFDFNLLMEIENEAKIEFILSRSMNQKLIVFANGDLVFKTIDGIPNAQGEFTLQPGSKLEYLKLFEANGSIRFESDITNPNLDIVATYNTTYDFSNDGSDVKDIAVKLKLQGQITDLGKNLSANPENVGVYIGQRNIANNIKDERYDLSDAFSLVIVGKLKQDLTSNDRNDLAASTLSSTASSLFNTVLTNFVNSAVGDYVSDIQIGTSETRNLTVSGKIKNIRYKIGTSTTQYQFEKTNLRIEYLFNPNFLIRLERKSPVVTDFTGQQLITEMGLKYKFEF